MTEEHDGMIRVSKPYQRLLIEACKKKGATQKGGNQIGIMLYAMVEAEMTEEEVEEAMKGKTE